MAKRHLLFKEQIEHLKEDRNLLFVSKEHISKFKKYLGNYNYDILINNYLSEDFFQSSVEKDKKNYIFKNNISSEFIINIFEFDKSISIHFLKRILEIERRISTAIVYLLPKIFKKKSKNKTVNSSSELIEKMQEGLIYKLSDEEWNIVFPNYKKFNMTKDKLVKYCFDKDNDTDIKKLKNDLLSKYSYIENVPIWSMSYYWTLGTIKSILNSLSISSRKRIINYIFGNNKTMNDKEFLSTIEIFNNLRNRICHNNSIYNFSYVDSYYEPNERNKDKTTIKKVIEKFFKDEKIKPTNTVHLRDVVLLIRLFKIEEETTLENKIIIEIDKCIEKITERSIKTYKEKNIKLKDKKTFNIIVNKIIYEKNQ